jgi:hypothetical protein
VGRLGILPAWLVLTAASLVISGLLAWGVTSALALKSSYDAQAAYFNQFTSYYQTCRDLAAQGKPCNLQGPATTGPGLALGGMSTYLIIGGAIFAVLLLMKR